MLELDVHCIWVYTIVQTFWMQAAAQLPITHESQHVILQHVSIVIRVGDGQRDPCSNIGPCYFAGSHPVWLRLAADGGQGLDAAFRLLSDIQALCHCFAPCVQQHAAPR